MNPHAFCELSTAHHALRNVEPVREIVKRAAAFDPEINRQLIEAIGQLPGGVVRR